MTPTIDIIGAGIGGLTTAIALQSRAIESRVFEQAEQIKPLGAGILLGINAMQVFDRLGLSAEIEARGQHIISTVITDSRLVPLSHMDLGRFEGEYGARTIAIQRSVLHRLLLDRLGPGAVALGHRLRHLEPGEHQNRLLFADGAEVVSAATIGADGIHSNVRTALFPESSLRSANQTCWRGVAEYSLPSADRSQLVEAWGDAGRFGFVQVAANRVYWYALRSRSERDADLTVTDLRQLFGSFDPVVPTVLAATDPTQVIVSKIEDLRPLPRWHSGRTCLVGDAAHAVTPNLGQGACQAIEDGYTLAACLDRWNLERAFTEYQTVRAGKAGRVRKYSWQMGKLAHLSNPTLSRIRNQALRATPGALNAHRLDKILKLAPV